jgi:hypothetical protein
MDPNKDEQFMRDPQWKRFSEQLATYVPVENAKEFGRAEGNSFSGSERNRLFLQQSGNFDEATLVSGMDFREDGRGFALLDYDQDGFLDLGVISTQSPRFRLMKNRIADHLEMPGNVSNSVAIRLVGGNQKVTQQDQWSSRDPYGAQLMAMIGETTQAFLFSGGEGLSAQNSDWIHIGLGSQPQIDELEIVWPSGKKTKHQNIESGTRTTLFENPEDENPRSSSQ